MVWGTISSVMCRRGHCVRNSLWPGYIRKKIARIVWGVILSRTMSLWIIFRVAEITVPHRVWYRVYILRVRSEIWYRKSYILVWNRVRVFRTGRHTPTQKYYEYSPIIPTFPKSCLFVTSWRFYWLKVNSRHHINCAEIVSSPCRRTSNHYLTLSLPRVINSKFLLQPRQKYNIIQYKELGFS